VAWTYSSDPGTSTSAKRRDAVRLTLGDTDTNDQQLSDEEITYFLSQAGDGATIDCVRNASLSGAKALRSKYARQVDTTHGKLSVGASKRFEHYAALVRELESDMTRLAEVFAGGLSIAEKQDDAGDSDLVQPGFEVGMDDHDAGGRSSRWDEVA
jgi:hypothetical protein